MLAPALESTSRLFICFLSGVITGPLMLLASLFFN
jgi:hypothetical protein